MNKLIKAGVFSAYYKWQRTDRVGKPINCTGFTQPDTIKINHTTGDGREHSAYIVPDQGVQGPEWALYYTIPGFKDNLLTRFTLMNHAIYSISTKCLQGKPQVVREELLNEEFPQETDQTTSAFDTALKRYLEKISCSENLKDNLLC